MLPIIAPLLEIGSKLIDKLIPDPTERDKAKLSLLELQQKGELDELHSRMTAIVAEAQSTDPWTSRARPSFLWTMYIIILASIPMGVVTAISPETATHIITGFKGWLAAIPEDMWYLMGAGYLGYTGARQYGKAKGTDK